MDQYSCFGCGMVSRNQIKVVKHMKEFHKLKVEEEAETKVFSCSECDYKNGNMSNYKNHMMNVHSKKAHEWMVGEIKEEFFCEECETIFPEKSVLTEHMNRIHENGSVEFEGNESEHEESYEDFAMEYTPKKAKPEKQDGINIKGKSDEFKDASEKILKIMDKNGKKFTIWDNKVKITSLTKSGYSTTINVEVTTKKQVILVKVA